MRKVFVIIMILLFPLSVFAKDTCDSNAIKIQSIELENSTGHIEELNESSISNQKINLGLKMDVVGDSAEYKIVVKNNSNEDYYFDERALNIDMESVNYEVSFDDNTNLIKGGEEKTIYLKVSYKEQMDASNFNNGLYDGNQVVKLNVMTLDNPFTGRFLGLLIFMSLIIGFFVLYKDKKKTAYLLLLISFTIPFSVKAVCIHSLEVNTNLVIDARNAVFLPGKEVNIKMKQLAGDDTSTVTNGYKFSDTLITSIEYSVIEPVDSNKEDKNIVSTTESGYPIYMWFENRVIYWWSEDKTPALNEDASNMFDSISNLNNISGLEQFDTSNTISFNNMFYFSGLTSIETLNKWNTSKVEDMSWIFMGCRSLVSLSGLEDWDTSNVIDLSYAFSYNMVLEDMSSIKNWDVSKVTSMVQLFSSCLKLEEVDLSRWITSDSLSDLSNMFGMWNLQGAGVGGKLKRILLSSNFNTHNVTSLGNFLAYNYSIEDYSFLQYLDTSSVTSMAQAFLFNTNLTSLEYMKDWDTSKVKYMDNTFWGCSSLESLNDLSSWDVSSVTGMSGMFNKCSSLKTLTGLENWNVSNVTNMSVMFSNNSLLKSVEALQDWDTLSVVNMSSMFADDKALLSTKGLKEWDTSSVQDMSLMFFRCEKMVEIDLPNWNVSNVIDMLQMFAGCSKVRTIDISHWNTGSATSLGYMFVGLQLITELDIHNFDTRNVTDFRALFALCNNLEVIYVGENWDTSANTADPSQVFVNDANLRNYNPSNSNYQSLSYAHTGEGGYLTLKTD